MFNYVKKEVEAKLASMKDDELFVVDIEKDKMWDVYISSFPEGTNPIFRERTEHDCSCCRNFIKNVGRVVGIANNKMVSIWDVVINNKEAADIYQPVVDALSKLVKSGSIVRPFRTKEKHYGGKSVCDNIDKSLIWDHFYCDVSNKFITKTPETDVGVFVDNKSVLESSLKLITIEACDTVIDLIKDKILYRGEEHLHTVELLKKTIEESDTVKNKNLFYWTKSIELGMRSRFKNTVIGTLLLDISENMEIDQAVHRFDAKMDGYKRTTAVVTRAMIEKAEKRVNELGFASSLQRRYAVKDDITVANVLYVDRSVKIKGNIFDELRSSIPDTVKGKPKDILIDDFLSNIPEGPLELMISNHNNLMSLIAPLNSDAPNILKWNNNFSWTYNGDITDSMRERVKEKGGKVDGILRFSIQWNDDSKNLNDLDAHCIEPHKNLIYYGRKVGKNGALDVDIIHPSGVAVENIIFPKRLDNGTYQFMVNNFNDRGGIDFDAEIEFDGQIHSFAYRGRIPTREVVKVADVTYNNGNFSIKQHLKSNTRCKDLWGITTNKWTPIDMIMMSPNFWDGQKVGNKHVFFILNGCINPGEARGLYNEFLSDKLMGERKVFEYLGAKLKTPKSSQQLSGVGYSSTIQNSVLCKSKSGIHNILFGVNHV